MAEYTYTVTVASGNLYGGGTGNVFYLNGARNSTGPGTVSWVNGGTLRFDQSNSSNDNHPLVFSTTTNTGGIISSGVTYYLDGSSNYANYVNTTTFNAATTRYVEITPSSQNDFYYLCYVHGIGMGGIMDITSTTWGALTWGEGVWGEQGNISVSATGLSTSSSIGSLTSVTGGSDVSPSGQSLTAVNAGAVGGTSVDLAVSGISASAGVGQVVSGIGAVVTGSSLTTSIGAVTIDETKLTGEGWGRDTWGSLAWGDKYSAQATGQSLTSAQGSVVAKTDVDVSVTGLDLLTITQGLSSIQIDNNVFVFASEDQLDTSVGSTSQTGLANIGVTGNSASTSIGQVVPEPKIPVDVTGVSLTASIGTFSLVQGTTEPATGQSATISLGTVDPVAVYPVTTAGLLTSSVGSVTATGTAVFPVTGIGLTSNIGSVNVTPWSEINPGVNNVWTEVDKAA
jgi:hypothetical protein